MLNLDETLETTFTYSIQKNFFSKFFFYSLGVISFINFLREQIPEIKLIQLIPGFYILLLFTSLLYLFFASDFQSNLPSEIDFKKEYGTKTTGKISLILISKTSTFFLFSIFILALITIVPLSLDSFNYYSEEALENLWSFEEVLNLEKILLFYLSLFSQIPIIVFSFLTNENYLLLFPRIGRVILFLAIVIAGIVTPTIDGFTQFNFTSAIIFLYLFIINVVGKRLNIKNNEFNSLNS